MDNHRTALGREQSQDDQSSDGSFDSDSSFTDEEHEESDWSLIGSQPRSVPAFGSSFHVGSLTVGSSLSQFMHVPDTPKQSDFRRHGSQRSPRRLRRRRRASEAADEDQPTPLLSVQSSPARYSNKASSAEVPLVSTSGATPVGASEMQPLLKKRTRHSSTSSDVTQSVKPGCLGRFGMDRESLVKGLIFGLVNSIILVPVMISFAQIIFRDEYFQSPDRMPYLIKLVMLSSTVHQLCFTLFSSLDFAVGQVQDAGLIFLSTMSSSIVHSLHKELEHESDSEREAVILATTLCWLAMSTAMLGAAVWLTGKLKLASLVQYLPMPVVGGYLAYIGLYCLEAGLSLMSQTSVSTIKEWGQLFTHDRVLLMLPGVLLGVALFIILGRFRHYAVLPCCLMTIPVVFHIILAAGGWSLDDARASLTTGWLAPTSAETDFWLVWKHYDFSKIRWHCYPQLIPTWLAMYFVVTFSSSLDVAAIQMELGTPLNFNKELKMVGISNFCSGITGGFTGSYIFSQTLFTMRASISNRFCGWVIITCQCIIFVLPISILAYVPKLFFGAILTFISLDLLTSWLWHSRLLMHWTEYLIVWATFGAMCGLNLEFGMLIGIGVAILVFLVQYANTSALSRVYKGSNVVRGFEQRKLLLPARSSIVAMELHGYLFFGSSVNIMNELKQHVIVERDEVLDNPLASKKQTDVAEDQDSPYMRLMNTKKLPPLSDDETLTRFVILDFENVPGVDATAVRTCFLGLRQLFTQYDVDMVFTNQTEAMQKLFRTYGLIAPAEQPDALGYLRSFPTLEEGMEWCEDQLLGELSGETTHPRSMIFQSPGLEGFLKAYNPNPLLDLTGIDQYAELVTYKPGEQIFSAGDSADNVYFLHFGEVSLFRFEDTATAGRREVKVWIRDTASKDSRKRVLRFDQGGVIGTISFFLNTARVLSAEALTDCGLFRITRAHYEDMLGEAPHLAAAVQTAVVKSLSLTVSQSYHAIVN
eukprot:m.225666 g.225666  ORF g.225666 m.225666 type:complete len:984 (-) comp18784_c0_seq2:379-3330(-)